MFGKRAGAFRKAGKACTREGFLQHSEGKGKLFSNTCLTQQQK